MRPINARHPGQARPGAQSPGSPCSKHSIRANHRLLQKIGVVPTKVANFIADIESSGGAAKICGAGAITGDNAGVVLLLADPGITEIAQRYGYELQTLEVDPYGTRIV